MTTNAMHLTRAETITRIRAALRRRSGKTWSVTGGRGTVYGWLKIDAPPQRRTFDPDGTGPGQYEYGCTSLAERRELAGLLGLPNPIHCQGHSIPSSNDYYQEYVDRAEGRTPSVIGQPYWD